MTRTPPIGRRLAMLVLSAAVLAGCGSQHAGTSQNPEPSQNPEKGQSMDLSSLETAIVEASPRVGQVEEMERRRDGLGQALYLLLRLDGDEPVSTDELDTIVEAAWQAAPFEPNAIRLVAFAGGDQAVDLEEPAQGLDPMGAQPYGNLGVNLVGMAQRYGEWTSPQ